MISSVRRAQPPEWADSPSDHGRAFATAHAMRRSRVEYKLSSIYDLSPESVGTFDVVFCGSLILHLFNPLRALIALRSVTKGFAIVETVTFPPSQRVEEFYPDQPMVWFGEADHERSQGRPIGSSCVYWRISTRALCDMLRYAGFSRVIPGETAILSGHGSTVPVTSAVAYA